MSKLPVSIIILAHQDQAVLKDVIASVEWASQVIVYWTSQNQVPAWLEKLDLTFVKTSINQSDFSAYRNNAASYATESVLFYVDSDEVVAATAPTQITTLLNQSDWKAASILRKDIFLGKELKWGEVRNVQIIRLFRKGHVHFQRQVHERAKVDGPVVQSGITLNHYAHANFSEFISSILLYISLEASERKKKKERVSAVSLFAWPVGKFLWNYFMKLGILDGWRGLIYCLAMSLHSFGLRATLYESQ